MNSVDMTYTLLLQRYEWLD